jgi:inner membrane protein YidH
MSGQESPEMPKLDRSTQLAVARTRAAYERTMMAWIRTATSLITFGFSIYKFFQIERPRPEERVHLIGPRQFALMLVSVGLFSLLLATLEYRTDLRELSADLTRPRRSLAVVVAALVALLGLVALYLVAFRQ